MIDDTSFYTVCVFVIGCLLIAGILAILYLNYIERARQQCSVRRTIKQYPSSHKGIIYYETRAEADYKRRSGQSICFENGKGYYLVNLGIRNR